MTQKQLERAVARATGESVAEIRRRGFGQLEPANVCFEPLERGPRVVDWDELALQRLSLYP